MAPKIGIIGSGIAGHPLVHSGLLSNSWTQAFKLLRQ